MQATRVSGRVHTLLRHLTSTSPSVASSNATFVQRSSRQSWNFAVNKVALTSTAIRSHSTASSGSVSLLPPQSASDAGRLTVVLDMDETLLHSSLVPLPRPGVNVDPRSIDDHEDEIAKSLKDPKPVDYRFDIGSGKEMEHVKSTLRPGLREFLEELSQHFEPILFTSAMQIYAEPLLNKIESTPSDASKQQLYPLFRHRLYRPATVDTPPFSYVKDVSRLGRSMDRIVLIDNSWAACVRNPDNCIVVPDYLGEKEDELFKHLIKFLHIVKQEKDMRPLLISKLQFRQQLEKAGVKLPEGC